MSPRAPARPDQMLTVGEVADLLHVDKSQVYHWIRSGRLTAVQYPSRTGSDRGPRRIRQSVVDKFLADSERT